MKPVMDEKNKEKKKTAPTDEAKAEKKKLLERTHFDLRHPHTARYVERKLVEKGVIRMERHPADGIGGIGKPPPKSGHGGKYTWEGPDDVTESELAPSPPTVDERDPNYVDEKVVRGDDEEVAEYVVGEVEVPKAEEVGVARIDVDPRVVDKLAD